VSASVPYFLGNLVSRSPTPASRWRFAFGGTGFSLYGSFHPVQRGSRRMAADSQAIPVAGDLVNAHKVNSFDTVLTYLESTLAEVHENKSLYLSLE
jgi:hypothetical protein